MAERLNKRADAIRGLVDHRLKSVAADELRDVSTKSHIDEDTIAAYLEGRLADSECKPVLAHLASCGLCRRTSAQFIRLENQVDAEPANEITAAEDSGRLEALLSTFGSMVSSNEDVVFAYQNPPTDAQADQPGVPTRDSDESKTQDKS